MSDEHLSDGVVALRPWRHDDASAVFEACQDPEIPRLVPIPKPYTLEDRAGRPTDAMFYVIVRPT